jgi:hypothetical protein
LITSVGAVVAVRVAVDVAAIVVAVTAAVVGRDSTETGLDVQPYAIKINRMVSFKMDFLGMVLS